eukprot:jgi/Mesvir1/4506/Mv03785-RA.1
MIAAVCTHQPACARVALNSSNLAASKTSFSGKRVVHSAHRISKPSTRIAPCALTKKELVDYVAERTDYEKEAVATCISEALDAIIVHVAAGDKVQLTGFGTFEPRDRKAREGRNPKTGEKMLIKETRVPSFSAGKNFKDAVKGLLNDKEETA